MNKAIITREDKHYVIVYDGIHVIGDTLEEAVTELANAIERRYER